MDYAHQVIVAALATNQTSDKQQAVALMAETISNTGVVPKEASADAGYYSAQAVSGLQELGVDPYVAPEQTRHGRVPPPAPRGRIPLRRAGANPPRPGTAAGTPRSHTPSSLPQGPDASEVTDQAGS